MRISGPIAIESVPPVPWKNGGGTTRTLAVEPQGATFDDFLWRISLARIDAPSDFSAFSGIDRTILLWRGEGVILRSAAWPQQSLTESLRPFCFRGEDAVTCELIGKPAEDLNLMARRGAVTASMRSHAEEIKLGPCENAVVLCAAGRIQVLCSNGATDTLKTDEYLRIAQLDDSITIVPMTEARFVCVTAQRLR